MAEKEWRSRPKRTYKPCNVSSVNIRFFGWSKLKDRTWNTKIIIILGSEYFCRKFLSPSGVDTRARETWLSAREKTAFLVDNQLPPC